MVLGGGWLELWSFLKAKKSNKKKTKVKDYWLVW